VRVPAAVDPLALPPVPAAAPARHPLRDAALVAGFVLALAVPLVLTLLRPAPETMRFENRRPDPWPPLAQVASLRTFATAVERAFADRLAGRGTLVAVHHAGKALLFGVSPVRTIMIGRDGWYYWLGEDGRSLDRFHRTTLPFADADIAALVAELERRRAFLAARGIGFVVVAVPEKYTIYPEHLPAWLRRGERTPLDRAVDAIVRAGRIRFVDLREPLAQAKARDRVYYRTDSHWNLAGASVGYGEIMRAVTAELPPDKRRAVVPAPRPPYDPARDRFAGDLVHMLAIPGRVQEEDFVPFGKLAATANERCAQRVDRGGTRQPPRQDYACTDASRPRLLMLHDSMGLPMIPLVAENFSHAVFVTTQELDPALLDEVAPDVVIQEFVERGLGAPAATPLAARR
jgi:hypothetical protein